MITKKISLTLWVFCLFTITKGENKVPFKNNDGRIVPFFNIGITSRHSKDMQVFLTDFEQRYGYTGKNALQKQSGYSYGYGIKIQSERINFRVGFSKYVTTYYNGYAADGYRFNMKFTDRIPYYLGVDVKFKYRFSVGWTIGTANSILEATRTYRDKTQSYDHSDFLTGTWVYKYFTITNTFTAGISIDKKERIQFLVGVDFVADKKHGYDNTSFYGSLDNDQLTFPLVADPNKSNVDMVLANEILHLKHRRSFFKLQLAL